MIVAASIICASVRNIDHWDNRTDEIYDRQDRRKQNKKFTFKTSMAKLTKRSAKTEKKILAIVCCVTRFWFENLSNELSRVAIRMCVQTPFFFSVILIVDFTFDE